MVFYALGIQLYSLEDILLAYSKMEVSSATVTLVEIEEKDLFHAHNVASTKLNWCEKLMESRNLLADDLSSWLWKRNILVVSLH